MLTEVGQTALADVPGMEDVRRALLQKAVTYYRGFLARRGSDPEVRHEAGHARVRLGDILAMLGQDEDAEAAYREAIVDLDTLIADFGARRDYRHSRAHAGLRLGMLLAKTGEGQEAERWLGTARSSLEKLRDDFPTMDDEHWRRHITLRLPVQEGGPRV